MGRHVLGRHDIHYNDIQYNDIQYNDIQHNDTQQKGLICDTHYAECHILFIVSVVMLNVCMLSVVVTILGPNVEKWPSLSCHRCLILQVSKTLAAILYKMLA